MRVRNDHPKERAGRPQRGLPVVRWRSSGLRPSLATADSLPSSHGQSGGCRRPQVLRYARTCAALRSTADVPVSSWAKKRAGRPQRGLPVVRWRSSGLRPSLATEDSLPSSHGQSGGCRRPQVLRYARTCAALRSTADVPVSSWAKKRAGRPKTRKRDRTSRGQSTRRHDRRRVFACLLVAPVFLLEGNSVTARLSFETPARLSLAALERLTLRAVYHGPQHHGTPVQRSECHHDTCKTHLIDQLHRRTA